MVKQKFLNALAIVALLVFIFVSLYDWSNSQNLSVTSNHALEYQSEARKVLFSSDEARMFENGYSNLTDDRYLQFIRHKWILEPSKGDLSLKDHHANMDYSQEGQSPFVSQLLNGKTNGFFVESGAADGEYISNSLFFEMTLNWTGLLIEPGPTFFQQMLAKNRRAYQSNTCLNTEPVSQKRLFVDDSWWGGIQGTLKDKTKEQLQKIMVQCFPLTALLLSLGVKHIDYLSLDIEGAELDVLKTLPFDQIYIDVIGIEYGKPDNGDYSEEKLAGLENFFESTGLYDQVGILPKRGTLKKEIGRHGLDVFYQRKKESTS